MYCLNVYVCIYISRLSISNLASNYKYLPIKKTREFPFQYFIDLDDLIYLVFYYIYAWSNNHRDTMYS